MIPALADVGSGAFAPLQIAPPIILAAAYSIRAHTLASRGQPVPHWRRLSFAGGLLVVLLALASPLGHLNEELFLAHMAQHLLLADLAALLLVLGVTGPILQPLLAVGAINRLRVLAHPLIALPLWAINLYLWHLPTLYQATLTSDAVHGLQHACFLGFGILVWMPLFGPLPKPAWFGYLAKFGYIMGFRFAGAILGNVFIWSSSPIFPDYEPGAAGWGLSPLADQGVAGAMMMVESLVLTVGLVIWLLIDFAKHDEERQDLIDLAESHGLVLDDARAARAVTAGRGAELRERLEREIAAREERERRTA